MRCVACYAIVQRVWHYYVQCVRLQLFVWVRTSSSVDSDNNCNECNASLWLVAVVEDVNMSFIVFFVSVFAVLRLPNLNLLACWSLCINNYYISVLNCNSVSLWPRDVGLVKRGICYDIVFVCPSVCHTGDPLVQSQYFSHRTTVRIQRCL